MLSAGHAHTVQLPGGQHRVKSLHMNAPCWIIGLLDLQVRSGLLLGAQQRHMSAGAVAIQEPDWDTFYSLVTSDEAKREVGSLRAQFNELRQKVASPSTVGLPLPSSMLKVSWQAVIHHALHACGKNANLLVRQDMP